MSKFPCPMCPEDIEENDRVAKIEIKGHNWEVHAECMEEHLP